MKNLNKGLIAEITGLAIDIQNAGIGTVFVRLSGHVESLDIKVYLGDWKGDSKPFLDLYIYLNDKFEPEHTPEYAIEKLTEILTNHTIHA